MKNYIFIIIIFITTLFSQSNEYDIQNIIEQDGEYFKRFYDKKLNGYVYTYIEEQKVFLGKLVNSKKDSVWLEWYNNGYKKSKITFKDGLYHGKSYGWYENGNKDYEGEYNNGDGTDLGTTGVPKNGRTGQWIFYYESKQKLSESKFKNGKIDGVSTTWYENGQKESEGNFIEGKNEGVYSTWYENGQIKGKYNYKNGELNGKVNTWYEGGEKFSEGEYVLGTGGYISWYESGEKKLKENFIDGKYDGEIISWYQTGEVSSKGNYVNGSGKTTGWYKSGKKQLETNYKNGLQNGKYIVWYENGEQKENHDYNNGKWIGGNKYYDSGKKEFEISLVNGNGIGMVWYETGEKKSKFEQKNWEMISNMNFYKNGNKKSYGKIKNKKWDGTYSEWWEDGKLNFERIYKDGELIETKEY